jgi:hypothetical protein
MVTAALMVVFKLCALFTARSLCPAVPKCQFNVKSAGFHASHASGRNSLLGVRIS